MSVWKPSKNHSSDIPAVAFWRRPLVWLNVLCLDAPLVAVSWQWLFARQLHVSLPSGARETLFLTAWRIYLADRWADSLVLQVDVAKSLRQEVYFHYRRLFLPLILVVGLLDMGLAFRRLDREIFVFGLFLGAVAFIYLAINFALAKLWRLVPLKEIAIGFLFAAGTLLALGPHSFTTRSTIIAAALFGGVCSLNCMSIAIWERDLDQAQKKYSLATLWPYAGLFVRTSIAIIAALCFVIAIAIPALRSVDLCLGMSATLLAGLHFAKIPRAERTAIADLVLLTPLAVVVAEKVL